MTKKTPVCILQYNQNNVTCSWKTFN